VVDILLKCVSSHVVVFYKIIFTCRIDFLWSLVLFYEGQCMVEAYTVEPG
jgi:hypothetical protein